MKAEETKAEQYRSEYPGSLHFDFMWDDKKAKQLRGGGLKERTASGRAGTTLAGRTKGSKSIVSKTQSGKPHDVEKSPKTHEELTAIVEGIRVVLIGDVHELPIMDMSIKNFTVSAADWWFNVRPSNTEPLLRLNAEARDEATMIRVRDEALALIRR